jgi:hypothetical protein
MQMTHIDNDSLEAAAADRATATSCRLKPSGFLRPDATQALARRCFR